MSRALLPLGLATVASGFAAVMPSGQAAVTMPLELGFGLVASCSLVAARIDRRGAPAGRHWPVLLWLLYGGLLTSLSTWYVQARGGLLLIELVLPTVAALLVFEGLGSRWRTRRETIRARGQNGG